MLSIDQSLVAGKVIIVDTNFYREHKLNVFLEYLYEFRDLSDIDIQKIVDEINVVRQAIHYVRKNNVKTIPEVTLEINAYLTFLNNHLEFEDKIMDSPRFYHLAKVNRKSKSNRPLRRGNTFVQALRRLECRKKHCEQYKMIQTLAKSQLLLIRALQKRDAISSFSDEQIDSYQTNLNYFRTLSQTERIHIDFSGKYGDLKGKYSKSVEDTDEKLVSAAFALALEDEVCILSGDTDLNRMLVGCHSDGDLKSKIGFIEPRYPINLLTNLNEGYFKKDTVYFS